MHFSSSSSHSQWADVSHCFPVFLLFSSFHLPPLSSHSVYSCQTPLPLFHPSLLFLLTLPCNVAFFISSFPPSFIFHFCYISLSLSLWICSVRGQVALTAECCDSHSHSYSDVVSFIPCMASELWLNTVKTDLVNPESKDSFVLIPIFSRCCWWFETCHSWIFVWICDFGK